MTDGVLSQFALPGIGFHLLLQLLPHLLCFLCTLRPLLRRWWVNPNEN